MSSYSKAPTIDPSIARGDNIKLPTHRGTWYVVDTFVRRGKKYYVLEHETYGDMADHIIVDQNKKIIRENVRDR